IGDASATVLTEAVSNLRVQSYSTTGWTDEPDDACTSLDVSRFSQGFHSGGLDDGESSIGTLAFQDGAGTVTLSAPGIGNEGSFELHYNADRWLEFDWLGAGEQDPFG